MRKVLEVGSDDGAARCGAAVCICSRQCFSTWLYSVLIGITLKCATLWWKLKPIRQYNVCVYVCTYLWFSHTSSPWNGLKCKIYGATNYTVSAYVCKHCSINSSSFFILSFLSLLGYMQVSLSQISITAADNYKLFNTISLLICQQYGLSTIDYRNYCCRSNLSMWTRKSRSKWEILRNVFDLLLDIIYRIVHSFVSHLQWNGCHNVDLPKKTCEFTLEFSGIETLPVLWKMRDGGGEKKEQYYGFLRHFK